MLSRDVAMRGVLAICIVCRTFTCLQQIDRQIPTAAALFELFYNASVRVVP